MTYSNQNPGSAILQESLTPISKGIGSVISVFGFRPKGETSPCFFPNQVQKYFERYFTTMFLVISTSAG